MIEQLKFDCPKKLSQKFWAICRTREQTIGTVLRELMLREIAMFDPEFSNAVREQLGDIHGGTED